MEALVNQVFAACKPRIDALAQKARAAHPAQSMAMLLEQRGDGQLVGGCVDRASAISRVETTRAIEAQTRRAIVADLSSASPTHIPVVLMVHGPVGLEVGVWRLTPPLPKSVGFRVDDEQALAHFLATTINAKPGETVSAWARRAIEWAHANKNHPHAQIVLQRAKEAGPHFFTLGWPIAWGMNACPRIIVPHKLGAALMATNPGDDSDVMTCAPWSAYTIEIPPELVRLEIDGKQISFDVVGVWRNLDGESYINVYSRSADNAFGGRLAFPVPEFEEERAWDADTTTLMRASECLQRLVIGTELEMCDPANVKGPKTSHRGKGTATPRNNIHRLVRSVTIDCREAIAEYLDGERKKSPTLRSLTRGHWKQQAHGPRWSLRRWQHIEPYWKGAPGAPMAIRPHQMREDEG